MNELKILKKRKIDIHMEIEQHRKEILRLTSERIIINYILREKKAEILQNQTQTGE